MSDLELPPVSNWMLDKQYKDGEGNPIDCGKDDCTLGFYSIVMDDQGSEFWSPACTTCEFSGACGDVFNADEERFESDAPEDFKRGAARVMINAADTSIEIIQRYRPDTAQMIEDYAAQSKPVTE